jgi:Domain of unknown function (DUF4189)
VRKHPGNPNRRPWCQRRNRNRAPARKRTPPRGEFPFEIWNGHHRLRRAHSYSDQPCQLWRSRREQAPGRGNGYSAPAWAQPGIGANYGALAWDKETGRYGWSRNQATPQNAADLAISGCGATGCRVVIRMTSAAPCGASATTRDGKTAGGASRQRQDDAAFAALANCQREKKGECVIRVSECGG